MCSQSSVGGLGYSSPSNRMESSQSAQTKAPSKMRAASILGRFLRSSRWGSGGILIPSAPLCIARKHSVGSGRIDSSRRYDAEDASRSPPWCASIASWSSRCLMAAAISAPGWEWWMRSSSCPRIFAWKSELYLPRSWSRPASCPSLAGGTFQSASSSEEIRATDIKCWRRSCS